MFDSAQCRLGKAVFPAGFFLARQARRAAKEGRRGAERSGVCQVINSCKLFSERKVNWSPGLPVRVKQRECGLQALAREGTGGEGGAARCCTAGARNPRVPVTLVVLKEHTERNHDFPQRPVILYLSKQVGVQRLKAPLGR